MRLRRSVICVVSFVALLLPTFLAIGCSGSRDRGRAPDRRIGSDRPLAPDARPAAPVTGVRTADREAPTGRVRGERERERIESRHQEQERDRDGGDPDRVGLDGRPLPGTDYPGEAVRFRNLTLQDENGNIPIDGPVKAYAHVRAMQSAGAAQQLQLLESSAGISRSTWTWLGPGNIGGRIRSIAIVPSTPSTMFAGSVGGGIWKTTNTGASWAPVDDFMANLAVSSIVINPVTPSVMYAGTGEGFYNADGIRGAGIFKSIDGGTSWSQLAASNNSNFFYVNRLAIAPDGSALLAATRTAVYRSTDGGTTFTPVLVSGVLNGITDVAFNPLDATKAVASGYDGDAWYSTNGGQTWTPATGLPGGSFVRVEIAYAPSAPSTVYASLDVNGGTICVSTNGGVSYSFVSNPAQHYLGGQGWYDNAIWVNPVDPNSLIVGGIDLYRSTNGGATISKISAWYNSPLSDHADHHVIVSPPNFNNTTVKTFFSGDDGGIYQAADWSTVGGGGSSDCDTVSPFNCEPGWTSLNHNLGVTQFYGGSGHNGTGRILGGTQDNGTLVYNGNPQAWSMEFGGDGGFAAIDPTNANNLYGEYVYLALHRSLTGNAGGTDYIYGAYWNGSNYICKSAPYVITDVCGPNGSLVGNANFIAPFILDPNAPTRLLAGGWSLWRTNDATTANTPTTGPSWAAIKAADGTSAISAIAVAVGNSDIVWVGHNNGDVYKTTNGTAASPTWTRMDTGVNPLPNRFVTRITIDPTNPNVVYASFGGYSADNLYRTTDGGVTWTNLAGTGLTALPAVPVRDLKVLPSNTSWLYAATDNGVFASGDGGATWGPPTTSPTDGPANVAVDELFFLNSQTLVAVTHGRGMFSTSITLSGGGHIAGSVKNAASAPLAGAAVKIYDSFGTLVTSTSSDASGNYSSSDLTSGTYYAVASDPPTYLDQLYNGINCVTCTPTSGTPITVTAPNTTSNVNFTMSTGGQIAGIVAASGLPQANVSVLIYNSAGTFVSSGFSDASGNYVASKLPSGTYYARTLNFLGLIDQLFSGFVCAGCNPTTGTPITVTSPNTTSGVNFPLSPGGQITGSVRAAGTNAPLASVAITVYNSAGTQVTSWTTDASGNYAAKGFPTGSYYLRTFNNLGYTDQLYNGFSCAVSCTPTSGTPVAVTAALTTPNINFTLSLPGAVQSQGPNFGTQSIGEIEIPLSATGGNGTYTWSIVGGALPPGVSLRTDGPSWFPLTASAGLIGVATTPGTYSFTLRVTSGGVNTDQLCTLKISALAIRDGNHFAYLPDAFVGSFYTYTMTALNAAGTATWTATNLPPGLSLSSSGILSGTPTTSGTYFANVTVNDGTDAVTRGLGIKVSALMFTNPGVLPNAPQGQPYSTTLTVMGGTPPYTFSGCCAPNGLFMNSSGTISGTPTQFSGQGPTGLFVTATDANNQQVVKYFSIDVTASPVSEPSLSPYGNFDDCTIGMACSRGISLFNGGTAPFAWTATGLPPGMGIRSSPGTQDTWVSAAPGWGYTLMAGDAEIFGTPTALGTFNATVIATDALGLSVTQVFSIRVSALGQPNANSFQPMLNVPFTGSVRLIGGTQPYNGAIVSGALPAGITFDPSTMTLTGTPLETGYFAAVVNFTDAASHAVRLTEPVQVSAPVGNININSSPNLGTTAVGAFYSNQFFACCASSFTWTLVGGAVPSGMALSPAGVFSGTPTAPGTYTFIARATDASNPSAYGQRQFTIVVVPAGTVLTITTPFTLPYGSVSTPYNQALAATGGSAPITWSLAFNNYLPPGLTLGSNGVISGTPTAIGQFVFTVTASDTGGQHAIRSFSLSVYTSTPPLSLNLNSNLGMPSLGVFLQELTATGGVPPYHYSLTPGAPVVFGMRVQDGPPLPTSFSPSTSGGYIGVLTTPGVYNTSIRVTDALNQTFDRPVTFTVTNLAILTSALPNATLNTSYTFAMTGFGGSGTYSWSATNLPAGITMSTGGVLSGTPTATGSFFANVTLTDTVSSTSFSTRLTLTVDPFAITTDGALPTATVGVPYTQTLSAPGCGSPCSWTPIGVFSGISLNSAGVVSGTPTGTNSGVFQAQVTGSNGTTRKSFFLFIASPTPPPLSFGTNGASNFLTVGTTVGVGLSASGGTPPYTFTLEPGSALPPGVVLMRSFITPGAYFLSGRVMQVGLYNFTLRVTDANNATTTRTFGWAVQRLSQGYLNLPIAGNPLVYNAPYTQQLLGLGGDGNYNWAADNGILPGVTMNASGLVSGTPTNTGTFAAQVVITDGSGNILTQFPNFTVSSGTPVTLNFGQNANLGTFQRGLPLSFFLSPSGGTQPYSGTALTPLPPGLALECGDALTSGTAGSNCQLVGQPQASGTFSFTIRVDDAAGNFGVRTFTLNIAALTLFTNVSLPDASVGVPYSQNLVAWDNSGAPSWSIATGSTLPAGLNISSAGVLSGTPTVAGSYTFSLAVSDGGPVLIFTFSLRVSGIAITDPALLPVAATAGVPFNYTFSATGGAGPLTWSATSLPNGLTMSPSGTLSGTTTNGSPSLASIVVTATDGTTTTSRRFGLPLRVVSPAILSFSLSGAVLADVTVGQNVSIPIAPSGGVPPYTWSVASGSALPPGLHLVSGSDLRSTDTPGATIIAGTPSTVGQYAFDLIVTDALGSQLRRTFHLNVSALNVAAGMRPPVVGVPFSQRFTATGGTQPYTYSITPNSLTGAMMPPGLAFTSDGVLSGTPTATGFYSFVLHAQGAAGEQFTRTYSYTVTNANGLYVANGDPAGLSVGRGGFIFFSVLNTFGSLGSHAFNWTVTNGAVPPGLAFETTTSVGDFAEVDLAGRPSAPGTYTFTIRATDTSDSSNFAERVFTIHVSPVQVAPPPAVPVWPEGHVGTFYSNAIHVAGGTAPYTFSVSPFTPLPPGLSLDSATGILSGTPTVSGTFQLQFIVQDATPSSIAGPPITLDIAAAGTPSSLRAGVGPSVGFGQRQGSVSVPMLVPVLAIGGTPPYTVAATNWPGLVLQGANGLPASLLYVPNAPLATTNYSVTVSDSGGQSVTVTSFFSVSPISVAPDAAPNGIVGTPYAVTLVASGGVAPYTFSLLGSSDLPPGLSLSAGGALTGTPTSAGVFTVGVNVIDNASNAFQVQYRIAIDNAAGQARGVALAPRPITISVPAGALGAPVPASIAATGATPFSLAVLGLPGVTLSADSGNAPAPFTLNPNGASFGGPGTYYGVLAMGAPLSGTQLDSVPIVVTVSAATTVSATPTPIDAGATLTVNWANIGSPTATDWIALVPTNMADGNQITWRYLNGAASGSTTLVVPPAAASGTYDVRLYAHDTLQRLARSGPITVNGATISATPTTAPAGASVTVSWDHIGAPTPTDWISLAPVGSPNASTPAWIYTSGTTQGSLPFTVPSSFAPGQYEFRLFAHDTFLLLAKSSPITVVGVTVSVTPPTVLPGGTITVSWSGIGTPTATDWAAVVPASGSDFAYARWTYIGGTSAGTIPLSLPLSIAPGTYEVRLFAKDTFRRLGVSNTFVVLGAGLTASPGTIASGGTLTLQWTNVAAPTTADWLALEPFGGADGSFVAWALATGRSDDSTTLPIPVTVPAGTYEVRLFANNTFRRLAVSGPITITGTGPSIAAIPATVAAGGSVTAAWRNIAAPTPRDWVGVYAAGATDDQFVARVYTGGRATDRTSIPLAADLAAGAYELRLFSNDSMTRLAIGNPFAVGTAPTVTGAPGLLQPGGTLNVTWGGIATPTATDWFALVPQYTTNNNFVAWAYTTGTAAGARSLPIPTNTPAGTYELRLFAQDGVVRLASSGPIVVGASLVVTPTAPAPGATTTVTWTGIATPTSRDWVALVPLNAPDTGYVAWTYTDGRASDRMTFTLPAGLAPGAYDMRLFANDTFQRLAVSNILTVGASGPIVAVHPLFAAGGSTLTLNWQGIAAPSATDWIGVYPIGADDASYVAQTATGGGATGTTTLPLPAATPAGEYEVRLFSNGTSTRLAVGNSFAVLAGAVVQVASSHAAPGTSITINWAGIATPTATDWVALAPMNAPDAGFVAWTYTNGAAAGTLGLQVPPSATPGTYEVRLYAHDTWQRLAISNVVVVGP